MSRLPRVHEVARRDGEVVTFRDDPIAVLASRDVIGSDQVAAAFRFRRAYDVVIDAKNESLGFREWQDPGADRALAQERRATAGVDLEAARQLLGAYLYALCGSVCGRGLSLNDIFPTRRDRDSHLDMLKISLAQLASIWRD